MTEDGITAESSEHRGQVLRKPRKADAVRELLPDSGNDPAIDEYTAFGYLID